MDPDVLFSYATYPPTEYLLPQNVDFFCFNVYLHNQRDFERYLLRLQNLTGERPLILGEFGMDTIRHSQDEQAEMLGWHVESVAMYSPSFELAVVQEISPPAPVMIAMGPVSFCLLLVNLTGVESGVHSQPSLPGLAAFVQPAFAYLPPLPTFVHLPHSRLPGVASALALMARHATTAQAAVSHRRPALLRLISPPIRSTRTAQVGRPPLAGGIPRAKPSVNSADRRSALPARAVVLYDA